MAVAEVVPDRTRCELETVAYDSAPCPPWIAETRTDSAGAEDERVVTVEVSNRSIGPPAARGAFAMLTPAERPVYGSPLADIPISIKSSIGRRRNLSAPLRGAQFVDSPLRIPHCSRVCMRAARTGVSV